MPRSQSSSAFVEMTSALSPGRRRPYGIISRLMRRFKQTIHIFLTFVGCVLFIEIGLHQQLYDRQLDPRVPRNTQLDSGANVPQILMPGQFDFPWKQSDASDKRLENTRPLDGDVVLDLAHERPPPGGGAGNHVIGDPREYEQGMPMGPILPDTQAEGNYVKNHGNLAAASVEKSTTGHQLVIPRLGEDTSILDTEARLQLLLTNMSFTELLNQTVTFPNKATASLPRKRLLPFSWLTECSHSAGGLPATTSFPRAIGQAAIFSAYTILRVAETISTELRAHYNAKLQSEQATNENGPGLNCITPDFSTNLSPLLQQHQDSFGEDPFLASAFISQYVLGIQGADKSFPRAAATCHALPTTPAEEGSLDIKMSSRSLWTNYMPQLRRCITSGALGLQCSRARINGQAGCTHPDLLTKLKKEAEFAGFVMSEPGGISAKLLGSELTVDDASAYLRAGVNLEVVGQSGVSIYNTLLKDPKAENQALIRDSVKALFRTRLALGEFDPPGSNPHSKINMSVVGSPRHHELAIQTAMMTFVLLKLDEPVLPIKNKPAKIAVVGPLADSAGAILGPGAPSVDEKHVHTPWRGLKRLSGEAALVEGCDSVECDKINEQGLDAALHQAHIVFVCLGTGSLHGPRTSLALPGKQLELLQKVTEKASGKVVVLLFDSGPVDISWAQESTEVQVIMECFIPGQFGGEAIYQMAKIWGAHAVPAGRLPFTWPAAKYQVTNMRDFERMGTTYRFSKQTPLYPFGYGLSFSKFEYTSATLNTDRIKVGQNLKVTVALKNHGPYSGDEVIQLYLSWQNTKRAVPQWQLVATDRVFTKAGQEASFRFDVTPTMMSIFVDETIGLKQPIGNMTLYVGGQQPNQIRSVPSNVLVKPFTIIK